jgi:hypothetical protein
MSESIAISGYMLILKRDRRGSFTFARQSRPAAGAPMQGPMEDRVCDRPRGKGRPGQARLMR